MKKRKNFNFLAKFFGSLLLLATVFCSTFAQNEQTIQDRSALQVRVSTLPYMGKNYDSLPVLVTSVTTDLKRGTVAFVNVENSTSKEVSKLKLAWYVSSDKAPNAVLQQGETGWLRIPDGIKALETNRLEFDLVSLSQLRQILLSEGNNTRYTIQVAVSQVRYKNGSKETLLSSNSEKEMPQAKFVKASYRKTTVTKQAFCANQKCDFVVDGDDPKAPP